MGVQALRWIVSLAGDERVKTTPQMFVLWVLAEARNEETLKCCPSIATIASRTNLNPETVRRALVDMEKTGLLTRVFRTRANGSKTSTQYMLNIHPTVIECGVHPTETRGGTPALCGVQNQKLEPESKTPPIVPHPEQGNLELLSEGESQGTIPPAPIKTAAQDRQAMAIHVLEYWAETVDAPTIQRRTTTQAGKKRLKVIAARLKDGYSVDDIKTAIRNCRADEWHRAKGKHELTYICRPEKLDHFMTVKPSTGRADYTLTQDWGF